MPAQHLLAIRHLPAETWQAIRRPPVDVITTEAAGWAAERRVTMSWVSASLEDQARQRLARVWHEYRHAGCVTVAVYARLRVAALIGEARGYKAQTRACRVDPVPPPR